MDWILSVLNWWGDRWIRLCNWYASRRDTIGALQEEIRQLKAQHEVERREQASKIVLLEKEVAFLVTIRQKHIAYMEAEIANDQRRVAAATSSPRERS